MVLGTSAFRPEGISTDTINGDFDKRSLLIFRRCSMTERNMSSGGRLSPVPKRASTNKSYDPWECIICSQSETVLHSTKLNDEGAPASSDFVSRFIVLKLASASPLASCTRPKR